MSNQEILEKIESIDEDTVSYVLEIAEKIGINQIEKAFSLPSEYGQIIMIQTEEKKDYYFGINLYGFVEIVREDSPEGKIVFLLTDD